MARPEIKTLAVPVAMRLQDETSVKSSLNFIEKH
jgi:hypothetical protein